MLGYYFFATPGIYMCVCSHVCVRTYTCYVHTIYIHSLLWCCWFGTECYPACKKISHNRQKCFSREELWGTDLTWSSLWKKQKPEDDEDNKLCRRPSQYALPPASWPSDLESGVRVTCDVGYPCANFSLPRPLCSRLRPDVWDRQTSDTHHRLMPPTLGVGT